MREFRSDHKGDCRVRLYVLGEGLIRIRYGIGDVWEDWPSYGVSAGFAPSDCPVEEHEQDEAHVIVTPLLTVRVRKADLGVEFFQTQTGLLLSADDGGMDCSLNDWTGDYHVRVRKGIRHGEHFYGLGDKPADLNLRNKRFEMWGADHYAFKENSDPLYKNITFFLSLFEGVSYGIFFDNTCRSFFDFGAQKEDVLAFGAEGGEMDYYFFHERSPLDIIAAYTRLTGLPPMPPMWALGYHQSKWSYYPDKAVRQVAETMRQYRIPCDAIHLDIHHMEHYRSLTWDPNYFPNPQSLVRDLGRDGMRVVIIVNPGVKIEPGNAIWQSGFDGDCYCRRHDGSLMQGVVWPGMCHFPDFTNARVRSWWVDTLQEQLTKTGVSGIWNDMNEPVVFPDRTFPMDTRHDYDGRPCSHNKAHNIYGHCMASASYDAMVKHGGGRRPFNLSRSGYAGMQRFAATWTGDNCSSWAHLRMCDLQCQRLGASGVSFCGADAGGFLDHPTPELFCRWIQMSAFHMFFRNHSSGEYGGQEPWSFGPEVMGYVRAAIEERYRLLPYFYTQFYRYSREGRPIIRSLALQCYDVDDTYWRGVEFFVGDHLYVVPVLQPEARGTSLFVPEGVWYNLWTDESAGLPCTDVWADAPIDRIPVFVRGGAVIPRWPVQQYVGELAHPDVDLEIWWAPLTKCRSDFYEDAGDGMGYLGGEYACHRFSYASTDDGFVLHRATEGVESGLRRGAARLALRAIPAKWKSVSLSIDGAEAVVAVVTDGRCELGLPEVFQILECSFRP